MDEKLHLRDWMVAQVESGLFEGLLWEDEGKTMFRIPWKHAAKKEYKESEDAALFKAWAVYKGKHREGRDQANPSMWKTRLRCALNKSLDFREVPERNQLDITEPYKVYRILWEDDSRNVHDVCEPRSVGTKKQDALSPISLNSSDLLREHLYCNSRGSNSQSPPLTLTSAVSDFRMQVTLLYRGVSVAQVTTSSPDGCFILQGCPVVGNEEIYGRCTAQQISFPLPDHHPMTPDTRDAMGLLLGHLRKGVLVWVAPEGVFIKRFCQVRVYWSGPAAKHADTPNKLDRGKTFKLLDTPTFITELQNFSRGNGPPPSFEIDLCFGEEYPDPKMARNRKLIMARVVPMFAEDLLRRINLGDSRNERRSSTHME